MRKRHTKGFSLIEMIMVLVVLVALAGMLVPQIDFMRRSADKGTASSVMKSLAENIQLYRTVTGNYSNRWDSLTDTNNAVYGSIKDNGDFLGSTTLNPKKLASLTKIGITTVMRHDDALAYRGVPGDSGKAPLALADGSTVAVIKTDADTQGEDIAASIYPSGVPSDVTLVAFGFGPENTALGKTIMSPPAYSGIDSLTYYNRYICVFAVYDDSSTTTSAKRAQLKAVLDSAGDFLNQEIIEFNENALDT